VEAEAGRLLDWLAGERAGEVRIGRRP
jgi:hypothetical protein